MCMSKFGACGHVTIGYRRSQNEYKNYSCSKRINTLLYSHEYYMLLRTVNILWWANGWVPDFTVFIWTSSLGYKQQSEKLFRGVILLAKIKKAKDVCTEISLQKENIYVNTKINGRNLDIVQLRQINRK